MCQVDAKFFATPTQWRKWLERLRSDAIRPDPRRGCIESLDENRWRDTIDLVARCRIDPKRSRLWAEARSSLHPIHVETDGFEGYVEADTLAGCVQVGLPIRIELDAALLRSGNTLLDRELERRLEVRKYQRVIGEVRELKMLDAAACRYWVRGDLTLHGVTRILDTELTLRSSGEGTIELTGEKVIDMRDFGLTPPKLLIFRVYPEVRVRVRLVAAF